MPATFLIEGGKKLSGDVAIRGSKNTVLPLIAACLLTKEPCELENVPDIQDVEVMLAIAEQLGATITRDTDQHQVRIEAATLHTNAPDEALARKLRGSVLFAGSLLGRLRSAKLPYPGGDAIGARPLTTHLRALEAIGATVTETDRIEIDGHTLHGSDVALEEPSVTATENILLAAVLAPGRTVVRLGAFEPHAQELIVFLRTLGAQIRWHENFVIEIKGVDTLTGGTHRINPDEIEITSFAVLAAASRSELALRDIKPAYLDAILLQLRKMNVAYELNKSTLAVTKPTTGYRSFRIQSGLYPKLGSDHVPLFAVLATQAEGTTLVHEWLYENRLRYIPELQKMGANATILDPHRAMINGPTKLTGAEIASPDIRSGMTLIIAALTAEGPSVITNIDHIDRGYERIEERLQAIGADIQRVNE